jgi:hypothetical protein
MATRLTAERRSAVERVFGMPLKKARKLKTKEQTLVDRLARIEERTKAWHTKRKRATTMLAKLEREALRLTTRLQKERNK